MHSYPSLEDRKESKYGIIREIKGYDQRTNARVEEISAKTNRQRKIINR